MYLLAVVEDGAADLDGEAGGPVKAVPGGVCGRAGVRLEGDVGPHGGRGRPRPGRGPGGTCICNNNNSVKLSLIINCLQQQLGVVCCVGGCPGH